MDWLFTLAENQVLRVGVLSWFVAQSFKVLITFWIEGKFIPERFYGSGGMPSSHTSTIVSATTVIGKMSGFDSPIFALAIIMSFIVMYDASGVRRSVGQQAKILNDIIKTFYENRQLEQKALKELVGHKPTEVAAGALLGIIIANLMV